MWAISLGVATASPVLFYQPSPEGGASDRRPATHFLRQYLRLRGAMTLCGLR
jgi:hypothetical protein